MRPGAAPVGVAARRAPRARAGRRAGPRVAITGSACTGKTTLATALAGRLGIAPVPEGFEPLFDARGRFVSPPGRLAEAIVAVLDDKARREAAAGAFVADRCPLDLLNLWMSRGLARRERETAALFERCVRAVEGYDLVVLLPWGVLPLEQVSEPGTRRRRTLNRWAQFHSQSTLLGLARQVVAPGKLHAVPPAVGDVEARAAHVISRLERGRRPTPAGLDLGRA